jgi:hypothetical protein
MTKYNLVRIEQNRDRVSLRRAVPGLQPGDMYEVEVDPDGVIRLIPVTPVQKKRADRDET